MILSPKIDRNIVKLSKPGASANIDSRSPSGTILPNLL